MMVALLRDGESIASWIFDPIAESMAIAERGSGAWINGQRLRLPSTSPGVANLRGIVSKAFCPTDELPSVERLSDKVGQVFTTARCAGSEYPQVAGGRRDFALYWRTLAWDHAPGALLLQEAGGLVTYLDGSTYQPALSRAGLVLATNYDVSADVLRALRPGN